MQAAKEFFHRTIATILDQLSPYNIYYFMLKSNFINRRFELTIKENHLVSTAKDGTKTDYGIIHPTYCISGPRGRMLPAFTNITLSDSRL